MTLREVKEQLITAINAGSSSLGMKWDSLQVEAMVPSLRQEALSAKYNGSRTMGAAKRINSAWVQKFEKTIDLGIQSSDAEYLTVDMPAGVSINQHVDGFIYVGAKDKTNGFYKCQTRDELNTLKKRGFVNNGKQVIYLYSDGQFEIYGDKNLQSFWVEMVMADPSQKPGFNLENDQYPVTEDLLLIMIDIFKQKEGIAITQPRDTIADAQDTVSVRPLKANIV